MILVTGAGGYLGRALVSRLLATTSEPLLLWLHAADKAEGQAKLAAARALLGDDPRLQFCFGDLAREDAFAAVDPAPLTRVAHLAAVTRFNVDAETAERVNVAGAERLFRLAAAAPGLRRLVHASTVYAAGLRAGRIEEQPLDEVEGFANHYERSKWLAERRLTGRFGGLPWCIARIATAIADDESGTVSHHNAVHNTLRLLFYGLVSLVPGDERTPLYLVTADFAARAVAHLLLDDAAAGVYHVAHRREDSVTLGQLIDLAFAAFAADPTFRARRILRPLVVDSESFEALVSGLDGMGGEALRQSLGSVAPFARQLFVDKALDNQRLAAALPGYAAPDPVALVARVCRGLVDTRWGRQPAARAGAATVEGRP